MTQAAGRPVDAVFHTEDAGTGERRASPVVTAIATGEVVVTHDALVSRDGTERLIDASASPIRSDHDDVGGAVLVFRDVTHKERIDAELRRASALEAVGALAGGLAHDFNNLLTGILANIGMARLDARSERSAVRLREAEKAALRGANLTQQLLAFAKGGAPIRKRTSLRDVIEESASFALTGSDVSVDLAIALDLWPVEADVGQIGQVVQNLVTNARQAMRGGVVRVSAKNVRLCDPTGLPLAAGGYVRVSVRDTGVGIAAEHLPRIFDPFFTTKQGGSGLGLATVWAVVRKHDGHVTVDSKPGEGALFSVWLPVAPGCAEGPCAEPPGAERFKVLVMDDEEYMRSAVSELLDLLGYEAVATRDGAEAVARYQEALDGGRRFDAVILDLTVRGGMGGLRAIQELLKLDPAVRAIVSSGYSDDPVMAAHQSFGFADVLAKPYTPDGFADVLTRVLR
jgi:signal transduction histidine kinase/CheY-like chemotaxis protein